ncbi:MAG: hypothetical protein CL504_03520 [Actinobacteria bacterium]|nr:hypothetical protein [Actinomycetota bacterium]
MTKEILQDLLRLHQGPMIEQKLSKKVITGYCEPLSVRCGEEISWFGSSHVAVEGEVDVVRLICGDPTRSGPGFEEQEVAAIQSSTVKLTEQPLNPGSYAELTLSAKSPKRINLSFWFQPTLLKRDGVIASFGSGSNEFRIHNQGDRLFADINSVRFSLRERRLERHRWYFLNMELDLAQGQFFCTVTSPQTRSPGRDLIQGGQETVSCEFEPTDLANLVFRFAADSGTKRWDGRIAEPSIELDNNRYHWRFEHGLDGDAIPSDCGEHTFSLFQLPTRAVPGPSWTGEYQRWAEAPEQWNAVHFHHDDLYDAEWNVSSAIVLPDDLPSGIYCFRFQSEIGTDRVPFFVRPKVDGEYSEIALLMPTCTYMAYANHRMLIQGADFMGARSNLRPEHQYLVDHPEVGLSHYEKHPDGSGVMFSSRRRPILQLRPGADGWNFTPDTDINAFLERLEVGHDILTDEDIHFDGFDALEPYRVLVTGTHPEYWSTVMLDALEKWQRNGGRLIYLGGNGFYWRVAFSDSWPGCIELRRAEDGVRPWQTGDGENYHAWGGEYGGLWRRNGRAPNQLVGVGFAAQGFEKATHYVRDPGVMNSRAAWILDGTEEEFIGTSGLGGGAAGQEVDRFDLKLGSPAHAVIVASATDFAADMMRTKEEFEGSVAISIPDPNVRADIVFYETPEGGAVFSVGSISWFGALARNSYDNDIAQITENVVTRFLDPTPFGIPD